MLLHLNQQNVTKADCPLKETPDCSLVKDCTINGTPDCPLVKADNSVDYAGKKKAPNNDLHAFYRESS